MRSLALAALSFLVLALFAAPAAAAPRIEHNVIVLDAAFTFVADTADLTPESATAVQQLAEFLTAKNYLTRARIEGHVATPGASGQSLSERRALAVARALVAAKADCTRLLPVGFGDTKPIAAPRSSPENSRIEIHVAALRGRLVGGMPEDGGGHPAGSPCEN